MPGGLPGRLNSQRLAPPSNLALVAQIRLTFKLYSSHQFKQLCPELIMSKIFSGTQFC